MGCEIARMLAARLGFRLVWREAINEAAQRAGAPELALHAIDELGLLGVRPSQTALRSYQDALTAVVHELAASGNVIIVGRAGQAILRGEPGVFHVRIVAPEEMRALRLMQRHKVTLDAARALVQASDHSRKTFLRKFYSLDWNDPLLYDLIINTATITPPAAAEVIASSYQVMQETLGDPHNQDFCVD